MKRRIFIHTRFLEDSQIEVETVCDIPSAGSIGELLKIVCGEDEHLYFKLVDEQNNLRPHVVVFLDSTPHRRLAVPIGSCENISIIPALSGG